MSHFAVLVIGDGVEDQLAPFHEFECTGTDNEYVQNVDITAEVIADGTKKGGKFNLKAGLSYHGLSDRTVTAESKVDRSGKHKYGYAVVQDGELIKAIRRTNPNKRWDWWQIGGRWNGYFKVKSAEFATLGSPSLLVTMDKNYRPPAADRADQALKGDIDWEGMRQEEAEAAAATYDLFVSATAGLPAIVPWETIRAKYGYGKIEAARTEYHDQPGVKALRENKDLTWYNASNFACTREEYIQRARNGAGVTFAVLKNGEWHERGSMGWWGMVAGEKDAGEWERQFAALIDSLPDNTLMTIVDCHI